jgi:NTP pyrophosphatase (non-canonical NTP hydrolase)
MTYTSNTRFTSSFSFIAESANDQTPDETLMIMTYELGMVVRQHMYAKRYGKEGHFEDQFVELGDVISMARMFCEQNGKSFEAVIRLGEEHYKERMDDLRRYGIKECLRENSK